MGEESEQVDLEGEEGECGGEKIDSGEADDEEEEEEERTVVLLWARNRQRRGLL